jgi:hypothetical protein
MLQTIYDTESENLYDALRTIKKLDPKIIENNWDHYPEIIEDTSGVINSKLFGPEIENLMRSLDVVKETKNILARYCNLEFNELTILTLNALVSSEIESYDLEKRMKYYNMYDVLQSNLSKCKDDYNNAVFDYIIAKDEEFIVPTEDIESSEMVPNDKNFEFNALMGVCFNIDNDDPDTHLNKMIVVFDTLREKLSLNPEKDVIGNVMCRLEQLYDKAVEISDDEEICRVLRDFSIDIISYIQNKSDVTDTKEIFGIHSQKIMNTFSESGDDRIRNFLSKVIPMLAMSKDELQLKKSSEDTNESISL